MLSAPELSIRSGGLPPTKRGCSSWAIWVDGLTVTLEPEWFVSTSFAANVT